MSQQLLYLVEAREKEEEKVMRTRVLLSTFQRFKMQPLSTYFRGHFFMLFLCVPSIGV